MTRLPLRMSPLFYLLLGVQMSSIALPAKAQFQTAEPSAPALAAPAIQPPPTSAAAPAQDGKSLSSPAPTAAPAAESSPLAKPPASNGKATTPPAPTLSDLGRSLRNYFTEEELSLLFQYMKESVIASFKDEEVVLPPDLSFKLEILLVRMKREGGHYMDNLINQLEKDLKNSLKDKLTPPPIKDQPYNPWITKPWQ